MAAKRADVSITDASHKQRDTRCSYMQDLYL